MVEVAHVNGLRETLQEATLGVVRSVEKVSDVAKGPSYGRRCACRPHRTSAPQETTLGRLGGSHRVRGALAVELFVCDFIGLVELILGRSFDLVGLAVVFRVPSG